MGHNQSAAMQALSNLRRLLSDAERLGRGTIDLLEQAGSLVMLVRDAGLNDLIPDAENLYNRAMKLRVL